MDDTNRILELISQLSGGDERWHVAVTMQPLCGFRGVRIGEGHGTQAARAEASERQHGWTLEQDLVGSPEE